MPMVGKVSLFDDAVGHFVLSFLAMRVVMMIKEPVIIDDATKQMMSIANSLCVVMMSVWILVQANQSRKTTRHRRWASNVSLT
jgi:hypothetical protein